MTLYAHCRRVRSEDEAVRTADDISLLVRVRERDVCDTREECNPSSQRRVSTGE